MGQTGQHCKATVTFLAMGNCRHIPANIKELVVQMAEEPDMNSKTIRRLTGVSERTQFRVRALLRVTGEVVCTPVVAGRPRKLDTLDVAAAEGNLGNKALD
jgi:hypothetical protein